MYIFIFFLNINMYKLSVLSVLKYDEPIMKEWIEHYLSEGVDHFYLVDNNRPGIEYPILSVYRDYVTLIRSKMSKVPNTPGKLINNLYINAVKGQTEWILFASVNEYMFSQGTRFWQIYQVLDRLDESVEKILIPSTYFGSNGYEKQPAEIVKSFTKREKLQGMNFNEGRVICRPEHLVEIIDEGKDVVLSQNNVNYLCNGQRADKFKFTELAFTRLALHMNCYIPMSKEYYTNKCKQLYGLNTPAYNDAISKFDVYNTTYNVVEDTSLATKLYTYNPEKYH